MNTVTASAPGKLMLLGEHAVVYGQPCIVTAVDHRMKVQVSKNTDNHIIISAPDVGIHDYTTTSASLGKKDVPANIQFVEKILHNWKKMYGLKHGLSIRTQSDFSSQFGFGSSSAVVVATVAALNTLFETQLTDRHMFDLAYQTVLDVQGKGSGFDVAAAVYGGTLLFQNGGQLIQPIQSDGFELVVGYTGKKYTTVQVLDEVRQLSMAFSDHVTNIYSNIGKLVTEGYDAMQKNDWQTFGQLMNMNYGELEKLGVSSLELSQIVHTARNHGAYGAKLSGAGKGDCAIALTPATHKNDIERAIQVAGFASIDVTVHADGVWCHSA